MKKVLIWTMVSMGLFVMVGTGHASAATIEVDSTADTVISDGACTLREAINSANADSDPTGDCGAGSGADTISFNIAGTGPRTISATDDFDITTPVTINGTSQAGTVCSFVDGRQLQVNIDGSGAGPSSVGMFNINSTGVTIKGLAVYGFSGSGINIGAAGANIRCNNVGTDADGLEAFPNGSPGISAFMNANGYTIGGPDDGDGNLISGNQGDGISIIKAYGPSRGLIQGNWIGVDVTGSAQLGNQGAGISVSGEDGGNVTNVDIWDNVVSGNGDDGSDEYFAAGINLLPSASDTVGAPFVLTGVTIKGNIVGLSAAGTASIPNENDGIFIGQGVSDVAVGGPNPGEGNVLSGNGGAEGHSGSGLVIWYNAKDITVQGNIVGLSADGMTAIPNDPEAGQGIRMNDNDTSITPDNILIGGDSPEEGNLIAGDRTGIDANVHNVTVSGNRIGVDAAGECVEGLEVGIGVSENALGTIIGGDLEAEGNVIKCANVAGIDILNDNDSILIKNNTLQGNRIGIVAAGTDEGSSLQVAILQNSIIDSSLMGIDLGVETDVSTAGRQNRNDALDADIGPNGLLNNPLIINTAQDGADAIVTYLLDVPESEYPYHVEFFTNPTHGISPAGFGGGEVYVGYDDVDFTTPGMKTFSSTLLGVDIDDIITATVTDCTNGGCTAYGGTSEFSNGTPPGLDYGTAPGSQTLLEDNGAAHVISGVYLGACVNGDSGDGSNTDSDGPSQSGAYIGPGPCTDDRDGVTFVEGDIVEVPGTVGTVSFTPENPGDLDDMTLSGTYTGTASFQLIVAVASTGNPDVIVYALSTGGLDGIYFVSDPLEFVPGEPVLLLDGIYATFENDTGHGRSLWSAAVSPGSFGVSEDSSEREGAYLPGETVVAAVDASGGGILNVWLDANNDGDFSDAGEQAVDNQYVGEGVNGATFDAPDTDGTYNVRFRLTSYAPEDPQPYGVETDGEVEDYSITVATPVVPQSGGGGGGILAGYAPLINGVTPPASSSVSETLGSGSCPANLIVHNNMRSGDRNGKYSKYNAGVVTEIAILQTHINRILASQYKQAAGPVDGIFGAKTKLGVQRLQQALNDVLKPKPLLKLDGIVGPFTRSAINNSCGGM